MISQEQKTGLSLFHIQRRKDRLQELFNYTKNQIEAPLAVIGIVNRGRNSYIEVKCNTHNRIIKVRNKKQMQKEDLILCKSCSKKSYSSNMMAKMQEFEIKTRSKAGIKKVAFKRPDGCPNQIITPEMLEAGKEDYFKRGGLINKIGG